jgi:hypothetical protein
MAGVEYGNFRAEVSMNGTVEQVAEKVALYVETGATHVLLTNAAPIAGLSRPRAGRQPKPLECAEAFDL